MLVGGGRAGQVKLAIPKLPQMNRAQITAPKLYAELCKQNAHTEKQNLNVIKYQNEHETYQADKQASSCPPRLPSALPPPPTICDAI